MTGSFVVTMSDSIRMYSLAGRHEVRRIAGIFPLGIRPWRSRSSPAGLSTRARRTGTAPDQSYPLPDGAPETTFGIVTMPPGVAGAFAVDPAGHWMLGIYDGSLFEVPPFRLDHAQPRFVVRGGNDPITGFTLSPDGSRIYTLPIRRVGGCGRARPALIPVP